MSVLSRRFTTRRRPSEAWSGSGATSVRGASPGPCDRAGGAAAPRAIDTASSAAGQRRSTFRSIPVPPLPLAIAGREMLPDPAIRSPSLHPPERPRRPPKVGAGPAPEDGAEPPQLADEFVDRARRRPV